MVLNEQVKQLPPVLREELRPLLHQVHDLQQHHTHELQLLHDISARLAFLLEQPPSRGGKPIAQGPQQPSPQQPQPQPQQQVQQAQLRPGDDTMSCGDDIKQLRPASLLDYVTPTPGGKLGHFANRMYGIVLNYGMGHPEILVHFYTCEEAYWWVRYEDVVAVSRSEVPEDYRLPELPPYDPARPGVPVTEMTAAGGMLVQRGHDWTNKRDPNGADGEVGVLLDRGVGDLRWKVLWSSGSTGEYCVGKDGWYELSHLTVCEGSGAPLHDTQWEKTNYQLLRAAEAGAMMVGRVAGLLDQAAQVEVGILRDLKGHPYSPGAAVLYQSQGTSKDVVKIRPLPQRPRQHYTAERYYVYALNYMARAGDPVTAMIARQGLRVTRRPKPLPPWMQQQVAPAGGGGGGSAAGAAR